jgi:hypothetical protein
MFDTPESYPWHPTTYQSGTTTVSLAYPAQFPHYHIGHLGADDEGQNGRHQIARELAAWLNYGESHMSTWLLSTPVRLDAYAVAFNNGCVIRAAGPFIDVAVKPSWGDWKEDESPLSKNNRCRLIDALLERMTPAVPDAPPLDLTPTDNPSDLYYRVVRFARRHAMDTKDEHEVGLLQKALGLALCSLTREQRLELQNNENFAALFKH